MKVLNRIIEQVKPTLARPYKGGYELRVSDLDRARSEIAGIISSAKLKVEVFEVDVRLRSISIRATE